MTDWLTPTEVATLTGISTRNLREMRYQRKGFTFYKPTERSVLYDRAEIERAIKASAIVPIGGVAS